MQTVYSENMDVLDEKAAMAIATSLNEVLKCKKHVILAVPGGRSVAGIFRRLLVQRINWNKVHIFMVDERLVPIDDDESNFRMARKTFIAELTRKGRIPERNIHPFIYDGKAGDFGIRHYETELKSCGGKYDVVLLSAGEDEHIGALFPNHHSIKDNAEFYISMSDSPKPPKGRMSASRKLLCGAEAAVILFFGEQKREAFNKFMSAKSDIISCPARIAMSAKKTLVVTDLK